MSLQWWVEREGKDNFTVDQDGKISQRLRSGYEFMPSEDIRSSRIVGFVDEKTKVYTQTPDTGTKATPVDKSEPADEPNEINSSKYVYTPTKISTMQLLAQHVFTSFIWAVVDDIEPIQADIPNYAPGEEVPPKPEVKAKDLRHLIDTITSSTDLGTVEELYLCIIPALSIRGKLSAADCVINHSHERAADKRHVSHFGWQKAGKIYRSLFVTSLKFGPRSEIGIKATVVLADVFAFLAMRVTQTVPDESELAQIKELQEEISQDLLRADKDVLREIVEISYRLRDPIHKDLLFIMEKAQSATEQDWERGNGLFKFGRNKYHIVSTLLFAVRSGNPLPRKRMIQANIMIRHWAECSRK
jgi:hypothetical protein